MHRGLCFARQDLEGLEHLPARLASADAAGGRGVQGLDADFEMQDVRGKAGEAFAQPLAQANR